MSVKSTARVAGVPIGLFTYPGGRIRASSYTLRNLIHEAYDVDAWRILGGPKWTDEDRFDVEAKPAEGSEASTWIPDNFKSPPTAEMRRMMQALLADRFLLKVHTEKRAERIYELVSAKGASRLSAPKSPAAQPFVSFRPHGLSGQNATISQLAERLEAILKRPVANHTGLEGHFDFELDYPPDEAGTENSILILGAIRDQLGLKLQTQPGSIEVIVIDEAQKPSAN